MNKPAARISALSLSMLLFVGCATTSVAPTSSPAQQAAIALLEQGKPREAAQQQAERARACLQALPTNEWQQSLLQLSIDSIHRSS